MGLSAKRPGGRKGRQGSLLTVTPACVSNTVLVFALSLSTFLLVQLMAKQHQRPVSQRQSRKDEGAVSEAEGRTYEDEDFLRKNIGVPGFKDLPQSARGRKWHASRIRTQRNASTDYPSLDGLPIHVVEGNRRLKKDDIFVTKANYDKLMAGYKDEEMLVSKSGRPTEHFKQNWLIPKRSFPDVDSEKGAGQKRDRQRTAGRFVLDILGGALLQRCAVVGSSGSLLNTSMGNAIDTHDFVLRINQAPTNRKFHRHAGSKTSMRLLNTRWTNKYSDFRFLEGTKDAPESSGQALPLEESAILVVSRAKPKHFDEMVQFLRAMRDDIRVLYLSSRVVSEARRLLVSYRIRLDDSHLGPYYGGSTPSTGYLGVFMLLQLCEHVTVYGFGLDSEDGRMQKYHYFELFTKSSKKNEMNPTHSFDAERDLLRAMAKFGHIKYCGFEPHNKKHNKRCGAVERSGAASGHRRSETPRKKPGEEVHEVDLDLREVEEPPWE